MINENMLLDLAVVMPVYNEQDCIIDVVGSWLAALGSLEINYRLILLNDGSTDNTAKSLGIFKDDNRLEVINKANSGHGPTILQGYNHTVEIAAWVFQCDSDNEMKAEYFPLLWNKRNEYDALFGIRKSRSQNIGRKLISACSRATVRMLFGSGITDVNTPYRLIRASVLEQIIKNIPDDTFAPNVIVSGLLSKQKFRIYEDFVPHENRQTGSVSIVKWKLWKCAVKSFWQTISCCLLNKKVNNAV